MFIRAPGKKVFSKFGSHDAFLVKTWLEKVDAKLPANKKKRCSKKPTIFMERSRVLERNDFQPLYSHTIPFVDSKFGVEKSRKFAISWLNFHSAPSENYGFPSCPNVHDTFVFFAKNIELFVILSNTFYHDYKNGSVPYYYVFATKYVLE